jgi:hypothetical protein
MKLRTFSIHECHLLSINTWSIWLWVFPSGEEKVYLWMFRCGNIVLLIIKFFCCGKFYSSDTILLFWYRLLFPVVGLKIFSLPTSELKYPNRIFLCYLGKLWKPSLIPHKDCLGIITYLHTWCMCIQINDVTPATSQSEKWNPITNKLYYLNFFAPCTVT